MNPRDICTKFLCVSAAKVPDGHKVFCCHPLLQARSSGNIWQEELEASLAARFKKQRLQDSFMLGCMEWEWAAWLELVGVGRSRES